MNSTKPIHTTILGTSLFLECMNKSVKLPGKIAEVGAFEGGNALCALSYASARANLNKEFYIFDSFQGFPELGEHDPQCQCQQGDYSTLTNFQEICNGFNTFPQAKLIKGFVPETFKEIPEGETFSLVLYDCDLYQPALDTFDFFWERLQPEGFLLIHDFEHEPNGYSGVKKATHEYFDSKKMPISSFSENTIAVIRKP